MNKKILIGSIIAVALLLLMPSIPAIQLNTIKDKTYNNADTISLEKGYLFVLFLEFLIVDTALLRYFHGVILAILSSNWFPITFEGWVLEVYNPIIYQRGRYLMDTSVRWLEFWQDMSDRFGWGWNLPLV